MSQQDPYPSRTSTEVVIYIEAWLSHAAHLLNALSGQEPRINAKEILA
jgi:hypothetical protein